LTVTVALSHDVADHASQKAKAADRNAEKASHAQS